MNNYLQDAIRLVAVLVFIALNAFFVAAEFALVTVRWTRVEELVARGRFGAKAVKRAIESLDDAIAAVDDAKNAIVDAQTAVVNAQNALDKAKNTSPLVKAPFDGFVTVVNVKGGDEVYKGTIALQVADPTKFEASVLVSEKDFFQVKLGGDATVQLVSVPTLTYQAKVTYVAPTATVQQGVANYKVRVELQSLQPVSSNQTGQSQRTQPTTGGQIPSASSNQTGRSPRIPSMTGGQAPSASSNQTGLSQRTLPTTGGQAPSAVTQAIQLRQGMTVTVSIIVQQKSNVLLVPKSVITQRGGKSYVKVSKDGVIEEREIKTGISNQQYTEVTEGLSEGEKVVIPKATTSTSSSQQGQPSGGIPGMGIFR